MLQNLQVKNLALITETEVEFKEGLNILTGETGAGKSILIDSINAILGNRTSRELVRSGAQKACIWATFESIPASVKKQLEKCGYEVTDDLLLYREINAEGKGSCRVNGMPATARANRSRSVSPNRPTATLSCSTIRGRRTDNRRRRIEGRRRPIDCPCSCCTGAGIEPWMEGADGYYLKGANSGKGRSGYVQLDSTTARIR